MFRGGLPLGTFGLPVCGVGGGGGRPRVGGRPLGTFVCGVLLTVSPVLSTLSKGSVSPTLC